MGSPLLLLVFFALFGGGAPEDLASDHAALVAFRAAVSGAALKWNPSDSSPCSWYGVGCSDGRVTDLRLPAASLLGSIPLGSIGNLTALRRLSLRQNLLSGGLPLDLAALANLQFVHVQHNRFSGEIPAAVFALRQLVHLDLSDNSLDGAISPEFNNLTGLKRLFLQQNRLSGGIHDLRLPSIARLNVSFNQLEGPIPASLRGLDASSFVGNSLCGSPLPPCPGEISPTSPGGGRKKLSAAAIAGISIGSAVAFLFLLLLGVRCFRSKDKGLASIGTSSAAAEVAPRKVPDNTAVSLTPLTPPPPTPSAAVDATVSGGETGGGRKLVFLRNAQTVYDLEDLLRSSAEVLGKGTTGTTYKTRMESGMVMAVKRLRDAILPEEEFRQSVEAIGAMDHPNLVSLLAYYFSRDEKLLVYEYVPNGSLSSILHGNEKLPGDIPLDWEKRLEIAIGAARGVERVHSTSSGACHGSIKSSNILLTASNEAKLSDSGLITLSSTLMPNQSAYRAPEVADSRRFSHEADVYSFGVLLVELLTGKRPAQARSDEEGAVDLPRWVESLSREEWSSKVFDPELLRDQNAEEEMAELLQLAVECASQVPERRPSMAEVVARIDKIRSKQGGAIVDN